MVKPKYEVEKRTQTTPFLVKNSVFLSENGQSAREFQTQIPISPNLNVLFVRVISFRRNVRDRELSEKERESTRVSAVSNSNLKNPLKTDANKIVLKAGNEFYVCGRACDVSNPLRKISVFARVPSFLFRV